jgi:hypothetical protein
VGEELDEELHLLPVRSAAGLLPSQQPPQPLRPQQFPPDLHPTTKQEHPLGLPGPLAEDEHGGGCGLYGGGGGRGQNLLEEDWKLGLLAVPRGDVLNPQGEGGGSDENMGERREK